jgi:two-component sensor histidine kinase
MKRGETVAIPDIARDPRTGAPAVAAAYAGIGARAVLDVPLVKGGRMAAMLFIHHPEPRPWSPAEVEVVQETCERLWAAVERARAEEALRASEARFRALAQASSDVFYRMSPDWAEMRQLSGGGFIADAPEPTRGWLESYIHPEDRPLVRAAIDDAIRTKGVFELEHRVLRPDGSLGWTLSRAVPMLGADGGIVEWFGAASDVTARREAEERLRASEGHRRAALAAARLGTWEWDTATGEVVLCGRSREIFGFASGEGRRVEEVFGRIHPGDLPRVRAASVAAAGAGTRLEAEYRVSLPGGGERAVASLGDFLPDAGPARMVGVFADITERKLDEQQRVLLVNEMNHRAKNALAVVQATLRLTKAADVPAFVRSVEGRVAALARAHTLLASQQWAGSSLHDLVQGELAPFMDRRATIDGPAVTLPAVTAQPVAMAMHELATNAAKHGALSAETGTVAVAWRVEGRDLRIRWTERGGPPVGGAPERSGFGSRLLDGTIRTQLRGTVERTWDASGLVCDVVVPLGEAHGHR